MHQHAIYLLLMLAELKYLPSATRKIKKRRKIRKPRKK